MAIGFGLVSEIVGLVKMIVPKKNKRMRKVLDKLGFATLVSNDLRGLHDRATAAAAKGKGVRMTAAETKLIAILFDKVEGVFE